MEIKYNGAWLKHRLHLVSEVRYIMKLQLIFNEKDHLI